jgi:hypothetical protein
VFVLAEELLAISLFSVVDASLPQAMARPRGHSMAKQRTALVRSGHIYADIEVLDTDRFITK